MTRLIRTLISAAYVAGFDETTLRSGPAGTKRSVLGAFTEYYTALFLGHRTLESFREFGILPGFGGVCGLRPLPELLPRRMAAPGRAPGLPGSHPA